MNVNMFPVYYRDYKDCYDINKVYCKVTLLCFSIILLLASVMYCKQEETKTRMDFSVAAQLLEC